MSSVSSRGMIVRQFVPKITPRRRVCQIRVVQSQGRLGELLDTQQSRTSSTTHWKNDLGERWKARQALRTMRMKM